MAHSHQQKVKRAFDRKVTKKEFELGDLVLKWDAPRQDSKFDVLWVRPFRITEVLSNNTYKL